MFKRIFCTLCAILCLISCLPAFTSCAVGNIYEYGTYSVNEEEYAYLMSFYKRQILDNLDIDEEALGYPTSETDNTPLGETLEKMYREQFEQSIFSLIYSQALFDEFGLTLTEEEQRSVRAVASAVLYSYVPNGSVSTFNKLVADYGFSYDALCSVYEKQAKESAVVAHLLGENYSKITDKQKDSYYKDNYVHFQVIVVNTLYRKDGDSFQNLTEEERKTKLELEKELKQFLCESNPLSYDYKLLPKLLKVDDMSKVTYEDIWKNSYINDDQAYENGMYMTKPGLYQMATVNTLSQVMLTPEGEVSTLPAKQYFEGEGSITLGDSDEVVNKGDYFEYGTAFIKRLPLDNEAWKDKANEQFFIDSGFVAGAARNVLFNTISDYEKTSARTLIVNTELKGEFSLAIVPANRLDYDYFHPSEENN